VTKDQIAKKKLPDTPGVYFFLGARKEILYIGRATSLRSRVQSYFASDLSEKRSPLIVDMVAKAKAIDWTVTDSVLEAMILETNLIRTHKPRFNTISKDDKSYNHLVITKEEFPRVLVVRAKDLTEKFEQEELQSVFGPFPSSGLLKEALKIVRRIFRYYDMRKPIGSEKSKVARGRIDFNRQIGLYPNKQTKEEYGKTIRHIELLFQGRKKELLRELNKEMKRYSKTEEFEQALRVKKQIFALEHIQDVALLKNDSRVYRDDRTARIEAYDIAHLGGSDMVGVMTVVEGGEAKSNDYRKFKIKDITSSNDTAALKQVLKRRLEHEEWPLPQMIVVDGGTAQRNTALKILKEKNLAIPVIAVIKNEKHQPERVIGSQKLLRDYHEDVLLANAESHRFAIAFHKNRRSKRITDR